MASDLLTSAQLLYLEAFDQTLRAGPDPQEAARTRRSREAALRRIYERADGERPRRGVAPDPIGRILLDLWDPRLGDRS
jgi:hypothetical protein